MSSEKGFWKRKDEAEPQPERWRPPLALYLGDEDDELGDLTKLLASHGYAGFARGPRFRFPRWPWAH
jgi:hypothetical protein